MNTVSDAYLLGLKEARQDYKRFKADGCLDIAAQLESAKTLCRSGFGQPMADYWRGERDFWSHQLKVNQVSTN